MNATSATADDCMFCREVAGEVGETNYGRFAGGDAGSRIIWSNPDWAILPSLGPLGEEHLLMIPTEHKLAFGQLEAPKLMAAERLLACVARALSASGSTVLFFEHGCKSLNGDASEERYRLLRSGACTDHAHMHIVKGVTYSQIAERLEVLGPHVAIGTLARLREVICGKDVYLTVGETDGRGLAWTVFGLEFLPSQFMRRIIASAMSAPDLWDWRHVPQVERVTSTAGRLRLQLGVALGD